MLNVFAKSYPNMLDLLLKPGESCTDYHSLLFIIHLRTHILSIATMSGGTTMRPPWKKIKIVQKRLIRTITCSPYRAHTAPLFYANRSLTISDIHPYTIGAFMYRFLNGNFPDIFEGFFVKIEIEICINTTYAILMNYMYLMLDWMLENLVSRWLVQNCEMYYQIT